ncbi:MAG: septum formation initiator family protein [Clostridia bacterium]|nr:septum formation initiator family protein [Clostridia bacterium]
MRKAVKHKQGKSKGLKNTRVISIVIGIVLVCSFLYTLIGQQIRLIEIRREIAACEKEIDSKKKEQSVLKEKAEYSSSDKFYEDKARDEGYVREDEMVFVIEN